MPKTYGNFDFLQDSFPALANFGALAETYLYSDANSCLMKLGMIGETIVNLCFAYDKIPFPQDNTAANRINVLFREGMLTRDLKEVLHALRRSRNKATHENYASVADGKVLLQMAHSLCQWFMQTYGDWAYQSKPFVLPVETTEPVAADKKSEQEFETELTEKAKQAAEAQAPMEKEERKKRALRAADRRFISEAETRYLIDEQLRSVGWEADTETLRYAKGTRPAKGRNIAIAEWPTDSETGSGGYADYALFIGETMVGIIEAKKKHTNVSSVIDGQCKEYARRIKTEHDKYVPRRYGEYKVPFLFATNGRGYIKQYEEMSGIWFLDAREKFHASKALAGWPSPQGVEQDLERDAAEADRKLADTGYELLRDANGLGLRDYQIEAIQAVEKAIAEHKNTALLAMATGTGKTRTVLGMIYRFLSVKRFKRILYLVDRTALGDQTMDTFQDVRLENLKSLDKLYEVKALGEKEYEKDTRVHVATVQSLVKRILYNESGVGIGVSDYDCIIVDEAHRGYILDKEMAEDEALYRNQDDFRSKYRAVIDYFDAVKIALTATPALHTTEIFGKPVFTYDYQTAVADGYLADHDAPHIIKTKLSEEGIVFAAGSTAPVYDPVTHTILNSEELEDDLKFEVEDFNKKVVSRSFNETVLAEIARDIDPNEKGKTLIFAVDDEHADLIAQILKGCYSEQGVSEEAVMKITGSIANGNPVKIKEVIRRFKNETDPNIVVTVDLLTTGIDVEEIVNLVFLRRIKSRILYDQMLGRATRLCPEIGKTHFEIYDAVGLYQSIGEMSKMRPVVANPAVTFEDLIDGLAYLEHERAKKHQIDMILAKLFRSGQKMPEENERQFAALTGSASVKDFAEKLRHMTVQEAAETLRQHRDAFAYVCGAHREQPKFISDAKDELRSHERGYGDGKKPEDYLTAFRDFIAHHRNEIAALHILATRPKDLTRQSLKELKLILERNHFHETMLRTAWKQVTNQEIAADIISFIRQKSIGDALISKEERIRGAVEKTRAAHPELTKVQLNWLERIEKYLMTETILNRESFDAPQFQIKGGYAAVDKAFGNRLDAVIDEINGNMYTA